MQKHDLCLSVFRESRSVFLLVSGLEDVAVARTWTLAEAFTRVREI